MSRGLILRLSILLCIPTVACGGNPHTPGDGAYASSVKPGTREPVGSFERSVLSQLDTMEADAPVQIDGKSVVAGASYHAASGRKCRRISIDSAQVDLACQMPDGWYFVPPVFVPGHSGK